MTRLIGGANSTNDFYGDAFFMYEQRRGGNDTLISGAMRPTPLW